MKQPRYFLARISERINESGPLIIVKEITKATNDRWGIFSSLFKEYRYSEKELVLITQVNLQDSKLLRIIEL